MKKVLKMLCVVCVLCTTMAVSCEKNAKWTAADLVGTWVYDDDPRYSVTFNSNGSLNYVAPDAESNITPTYTVNGELITIRVVMASATVTDVVKVTSLSGNKMVIYYDGDLLFDEQSLTGEYKLTRK